MGCSSSGVIDTRIPIGVPANRCWQSGRTLGLRKARNGREHQKLDPGSYQLRLAGHTVARDRQEAKVTKVISCLVLPRIKSTSPANRAENPDPANLSARPSLEEISRNYTSSHKWRKSPKPDSGRLAVAVQLPGGLSNLLAAYVVRTRRLSAGDPGEVHSRRLHQTCIA